MYDKCLYHVFDNRNASQTRMVLSKRCTFKSVIGILQEGKDIDLFYDIVA